MDRLERALRLARAGNHQDALEVFEALVSDDRWRTSTLGHRAWLLRSLGRHEDALRDYEALVELDPQDLNAALLLADTKRVLGRISEAAQEAADVLRRDPFNVEAAQAVVRCQDARVERKLTPVPFPDTSRIPPARPFNDVIDRLERDPRSYPATVFPEIGRLLYALTLCLRPRLVLETGCHVGYSSLCIAQGLEDIGAGHLHSFDLFEEQRGYVSPIVGACEEPLQMVRMHTDRAGLAHRVTFHRGDSSQMIRREFGDQGARFDMAFVDGDHSIRGCLRDWRAVDRLLAEGGIVLLHDTLPDGCRWLGPHHLLDQLERDREERNHWINLATPEGFGLAIIQKRHAGSWGNLRPSLWDIATDLVYRRIHWAGRGSQRRGS
jgi:predicted O-methyltransferase YrrM